MLDQWLSDLGYASRIARRRPLVSLAIVASMALGIGGATAIFTVVDRVLLRPLPIANPDRVVWIRITDASRPAWLPRVNPGDELDLRTRSTSFAAMAAFNESETTVRVGDAGDPERVGMALVAPGMLDVLGIRPAMGTFFTPDDYAGASEAVVLTHRFWRRVLGGDPAAVGRTLFLNNAPRRVIGVLPPSADMLPESRFQIWRPLLDNPQQRMQARTASYLWTLARLKPGVPLERAQAEVDAIARQLAAEHPITNATRGVFLQPLHDGIVGAARPMILLLGGAIVAVLLIACASVGNLLVAQSHDRGRELSVRAALGGTRARLGRQLVAETTLLCVAGGAIGVALSTVFLKGIVTMYPGGLPRAEELAPDLRVLAASLAMILATAALAALPVVRQMYRVDIAHDLRGGGRSTAGRAERRLSRGLVVAQLALSVVLLFAGALLLRTWQSMARVDTGFEVDRLLTFDVTPSWARYPTAESVDAYYDRVAESISAIAGVEAIGTSNLIPFAAGNLSEYYQREGRLDPPGEQPLAKLQIVTPGFLEAVGLPLLRGRPIDATDRDTGAPVVVVNAALAAAHFPGEEVLGRRVTMRGRSWEIVGVVGDKRHTSAHEPPLPEMFIPQRQLPRQLAAWVVVRSTVDARTLVAPIRAAMRGIDPTVAMASVATMAERFSGAIAAERFRAVIVGCFAAVALLLATVGLYGVVSYGVSQRTREIGIRLALGERGELVRLRTVTGAMVLAAVGLSIGTVGALGVGRWLERFLAGETSRDPALLGGVIVTMFVVVVAAAYVPARRASRIDPLIALRVE